MASDEDRLVLHSRCEQLVKELAVSSPIVSTLLSAIRGKCPERVSIECIPCPEAADHVASYDRSTDGPTVSLTLH